MAEAAPEISSWSDDTNHVTLSARLLTLTVVNWGAIGTAYTTQQTASAYIYMYNDPQKIESEYKNW